MSTAIPQTMQAWLQTARGLPKDVLELAEQHPVPAVGDKEILVKVKRTSLNPVGHKSMKFPGLVRKIPNVVEYDLSGVVVTSQSANFKAGDEVFGIIPAALNMKTGRGALAQYAVVKEEDLAQKPTELSWEDAAGLPLVGCTAHGAILKQGDLKAGQTVFINGGATSVGRIAIGIAKHVGATVIVSCSSASAETCKSLGADEIVDYKSNELPAWLSEHHGSKPVDLIVDLIGNKADLYGNSEQYLVEGGKYILIGGQPPKGVFSLAAWATSLATSALLPKLLGGVPRVFQFWLMDSCAGLPDLAKWAVDGTIKVEVDSVHKFDKAGVLAAFDRVMSERAQGKVFIDVPQ